MFYIQNVNLRHSILAAIALMSLSASGEAKPKLSEIQDLPQTGAISQIRTGSDAQGNVVVSWQGPNTLYVDKISNTGVSEASATTIASGVYGIHDLVVKQDGSYLAAWTDSFGSSTPASGIKAVLSGNLSNVLDFGQGMSPSSLNVFAFSDGFKVFDTEVQAQANLSVFDSQGQPSANPPLVLPNYAAVTTNTAGDYVMAILADVASGGVCEDTSGSAQSMKTTLAMQKNDGQPVSVSPYNQAQTFNFGDGPKPNEKVELAILNPKVVSNASGEIVLVWLEELAKTQLKANGYCVYRVTQTLVTQRFNKDLSAKDAKPIVIASTKNKHNQFMPGGVLANGALLFTPYGPYLSDFGIDVDDAGEFVVAYALNMGFNENDAVMVRQFVNDSGKLIASKAIKMSVGKKPKTSHAKEKGKIYWSSMFEPSIAITNPMTNDFVVVWHHDYEDIFPSNGQTPSNCWRFVIGSLGTGCSDEHHSILKAARYSNQ